MARRQSSRQYRSAGARPPHACSRIADRAAAAARSQFVSHATVCCAPLNDRPRRLLGRRFASIYATLGRVASVAKLPTRAPLAPVSTFALCSLLESRPASSSSTTTRRHRPPRSRTNNVRHFARMANLSAILWLLGVVFGVGRLVVAADGQWDASLLAPANTADWSKPPRSRSCMLR